MEGCGRGREGLEWRDLGRKKEEGRERKKKIRKSISGEGGGRAKGRVEDVRKGGSGREHRIKGGG